MRSLATFTYQYLTSFSAHGRRHTDRNSREVIGKKLKIGVVVKHQRTFVVLKATLKLKGIFKSGAASLYRSLMTSLNR